MVPVDQPLGVQPQEGLLHRGREVAVHGEGLPLPVGGGPHAPELRADGVAVLVDPRVHLVHKFVSAQVVPRQALFASKRLLDHRLRRDARVVRPGHPERRPPSHAGPAHDGVLDRGHEGVAQVQRARDVGRGDDHGEGRARVDGVVASFPFVFAILLLFFLLLELVDLLGARGREEPLRLPPGVDRGLDEFRVVGLGHRSRIVLFGSERGLAGLLDERGELSGLGGAGGVLFGLGGRLFAVACGVAAGRGSCFLGGLFGRLALQGLFHLGFLESALGVLRKRDFFFVCVVEEVEVEFFFLSIHRSPYVFLLRSFWLFSLSFSASALISLTTQGSERIILTALAFFSGSTGPAAAEAAAFCEASAAAAAVVVVAAASAAAFATSPSVIFEPLCSKIRSVACLSLARTRPRASSDSEKKKQRAPRQRAKEELNDSLFLASAKKRKKQVKFFPRPPPSHRRKKKQGGQSIFQIAACDTPPRRVGLEALSLTTLPLLLRQHPQSLLQAPLPRDPRSSLPSKRKRGRENGEEKRLPSKRPPKNRALTIELFLSIAGAPSSLPLLA